MPGGIYLRIPLVSLIIYSIRLALYVLRNLDPIPVDLKVRGRY